jgi:hypothetical protein
MRVAIVVFPIPLLFVIQMEESKAYSAVANAPSRQAANFVEAENLFAEYLASVAAAAVVTGGGEEEEAHGGSSSVSDSSSGAGGGGGVSAQVLDAKLSVHSKALRYDDAVAFFTDEYAKHGLVPTQKATLHLVEMFIRGNQLGKAFWVKDELVPKFLSSGSGGGSSGGNCETDDGGMSLVGGGGGGGCSAEVYGALVRKLADCDRLQEASALVDEAHDTYGLVLRER